MQLLLLHPPRNVYVACEHRCVRARPRPCHKATEAQILGACTAWFPAHELGDPARSRVFSVQPHSPARWRNRVVRLDLDRSQVPAVCAGPRRFDQIIMCPSVPRQRDVPANASVKHSHHTPPCLLAVLALECTSEFRLGRTQWLPAYSSDAVARRFLIWERMPGSALLRRWIP